MASLQSVAKWKQRSGKGIELTKPQRQCLALFPLTFNIFPQTVGKIAKEMLCHMPTLCSKFKYLCATTLVMNLENLNVKHFSDYRDFLNAHFASKKISNPKWSYGLWATRLGLKATSSLTKIINNERAPGPEITNKLASYFCFDENELNYFTDLIRLSKIKDDPRLSVLLMERMGREHPDAKLKILEDKSFQIISNWFCMAIREMVRLNDFKEDPAWIQKRLSFEVKTSDIRKALEDLLQLGLLKRGADGKLITSSGLLHTTNDISSEAIKRHHEQMIDNSKISLRRDNVEIREFSAQTLTINLSKLPEAKELIRQFKGKFTRLLEETQGDETYQLQIQFFPLTKGSNYEH